VRTFHLHLHISSDDWLAYYSGQITHVVAMATDGQNVKFAAKHLHRFVRRDGVHGQFRLVIDDDNNFVRLEEVRTA
jgi:hypothetical protein